VTECPLSRHVTKRYGQPSNIAHMAQLLGIPNKYYFPTLSAFLLIGDLLVAIMSWSVNRL
jgi:hypothetical protein